MDRIETQLRRYYEAEAEGRLRPEHGERRRQLAADSADRWSSAGVGSMLDVGSGPAIDHRPFVDGGIRYVGADLAVGNARLAAEFDQLVIPSTLFALPFPDRVFGAGWSMSTFQHVPDERIDEAIAEFVRVLAPGAPIVMGLWGGRDEVIESNWATSGIALDRHFTLRAHDRITEIVGHHLRIDTEEIWVGAGVSDWEYHVVCGTA